MFTLPTKKLKTSVRIIVCSILCLALSGVSPTISYALDPGQKDLFRNQIHYADLEATQLCNTGGSVNLVGKDNIEKSYNYFVQKGLTPVQSAGIVGNFRQESGSGINPKSNQPNGPGRGIAQWSEGGRWDALVAWASKQSRDPETLDVQLEYVWHEMNNVRPWNETLPAIRDDTTVAEAATTFEAKFERADPRYANMPQRIEYGEEVLAMVGGGAAGGAVDPNAASAGCGVGANVEGYAFPVAPQKKQSYSNLPCNKPMITYRDEYGHTASIKNCHPGDGSPAYDLMYNGVDGKPIYAITDGTVSMIDNSYSNNSSRPGRVCSELMFHANNPTNGDTSFYWYGHIQSITAGLNQPVKAGDQLGVVATQDKGERCWGSSPHLHIDRGCKDNEGEWQGGGGDECRDAAFQADLAKIWEGLPE
jgi:hypothetical protein